MLGRGGVSRAGLVGQDSESFIPRGTEKSSGLCIDGRGLVSKCHSTLEGFILPTCGDAGKRSGKPPIGGSPRSSPLAAASGGAEHGSASPFLRFQ